MPQLTQELLGRLKNEDELVFRIAKGLNRRFETVRKWAFGNNEMLTSKAVILIIKDETGLSEDQILEPQPATL